LVLVEGQTEEGFIKQVVAPHLLGFNVALIPRIVMTKRVIDAPNHKGGGDFEKILADVRRLLTDSNAKAITTFFDLYRFPRNVPDAVEGDFKSAEKLEARIAESVTERRFKPYVQKYEFEGLLFTEPSAVAQLSLKPTAAVVLVQQRAMFNTVEEINDGPDTAPSKRILNALPGYRKAIQGPAAAQRIGLEKMRVAAPRFARWLLWLESCGEVNA
jgi:Domain of unknown function (DUF4276)